MQVCSGQITLKKSQNLPISNPKTDPHLINAHTKFGENPLTFTEVTVPQQKYRQLSKIDEICPFGIPNQISSISIHIPKFGENPLTFTQVITRKQKYG